jgi:alkanesulfonate monooxygenase SsuD/methylene tetrahydromethanopterin reductase-like flavin-dependent oxidoreductase (luciferase family)
MLDAMSGGRLILGIGRGLGRVEFDGFRVPMDEARGRFVESAEMILHGLESGVCEYDGRFVRQPRTALRPKPATTFRGRTYAAAVSAESMPIVAKLGVGILIIPQKPWETMERELADYRGFYRDANGTEAPPPVLAGWTFCDENAGRAREMAVRYIGGYWDSVMRHYELVGDHLAHTVGYEYYAKLQEVARLKGGTDALTEFFLDLQVWGTPAQCVDKICDIRRRTGCGTYVGVFSYAGMPFAEAERNMRLFARAVMPRLQALA